LIKKVTVTDGMQISTMEDTMKQKKIEEPALF